RASLLKRCRLAITRNIPWVWPAIAAGLKLHLRGGYDLIWATCDPLSSLIAGYWLSRLTGKPLVADIRDPITYGTEWARRDPRSSKYITRREQTVLHAAARTVYTSPLTTQIMQQHVRPAAAERMVTITNGFLAPEVEPEPKRDVGPDKCVFTHLGIVAAHRNPDILLQAFEMACKSPGVGDDLRFQFIGDVRDYDLRGAIEQMGLADKVKYLGFVPHEDTRRYVRGTDVLVMLQPWAGPGCDIVCGKDYEYLAARRPILGVAPPDGGDAWLINDTNAGIVTGVDSAERVADAMVKYWRLWKDGKLDAAAPTGDINRFERRSLTQRLAALFDEVLAERTPG
ncbi:MAG: glycosyltransferase, partial [Planctomycetota bacterium]